MTHSIYLTYKFIIYLKYTIKRRQPMNLYDDLNIAIVANSIAKTNVLKKFFIDIYDNNTSECSALAKNYPLIKHTYITGRTLINEIEIKKCIGALSFVLKENQHLTVLKYLKSNFPKHTEAIKKDDKKLYIKLVENLSSIEEPIFLGLAYLIYSFNYLAGIELQGEVVQNILNALSIFRNQLLNEQNRLKELTQTTNGYNFFANHNNFYKYVTSENSLSEIYDEIFQPDTAVGKNPLRYCTDPKNLLQAISAYAVINEIFSILDLPISQIITSELSPTEHKTISRLINNKMNIFFSDSTLKVLHTNKDSLNGHRDTLYVVALLTYKFVDEYKKSKITHFSNDIDELRIQNKLLEKEISTLTEQLLRSQNIISENNRQISELQKSIKKSAEEIISPVDAENRLLNSKILRLEQELEEERLKNTELNYLRNFVFSIEHNDISHNDDTPLNNLLNNKKIVIIGGHENWQNKMKKDYPSLIILNGHQNFDTAILKNADKVIFYTANLSHKIYYLAINYLRLNNLSFGYIGKHNVDLVEKELKELLLN